jgi:cytoskeletal protein CcmA (bactofilin family)
MSRPTAKPAVRNGILFPAAAAPWRQPEYETQRLECPHCRTEFEAARRAVSLRCPKCAGQIQLQNAMLTGIMTGNVTTLGQVRITRRGAVRGRIECGSLLVEGGVVGNIRVRGKATIDSKGTLAGSLSARSIVIAPGARLDADLDISPDGPRRDDRGSEVSEPSL